MSYCVHCGVELDDAARRCPLCHTPVLDPNRLREGEVPPSSFPQRREEVLPVSKKEAGLLLTAMLLSAALCCVVLNLFLGRGRPWSLYLAGAAGMLWIWFALPLFLRRMVPALRLTADLAAVGVYVYLISLDVGGGGWFWGLAFPLLAAAEAAILALALLLRRPHSTLTRFVMVLCAVGFFAMAAEWSIDRYVRGEWTPAWSLVVCAICVSLCIPLVIVRRVPSLREEARRRFHI